MAILELRRNMEQGKQGTRGQRIRRNRGASGDVVKVMGFSMRLRVLGLAAALLLAGVAGAACRDEEPGTDNSPGGSIDWVGFVRAGDVTYLRQQQRGQSRQLDESALGPEYARVRFKVAGNVDDPSYRAQDGDAGHLEPDTRLFEVQGYSPKFLLATLIGDEVTLYEADSVEGATTGADRLDIGGRVKAIRIYSQEGDGKAQLGLIDEPGQVEALVEAILMAPINTVNPREQSNPVALAFEMDDGLVFRRVYFIGSGELSRGIALPEEARRIIAMALEDHTTP